jgi:ComEC/Rec2-related protein
MNYEALWERAPLFRLFLLFAMGHLLSPLLPWPFCLLIMIWTLAIVLLWRQSGVPTKGSILLAILIILLGCFNGINLEDTKGSPEKELAYNPKKAEALEFKVESCPIKRKSGIEMEISILSGNQQGKRMLLKSDSISLPMLPGETYCGWVMLEVPRGPTFPGGFDYREFLQRKNIRVIAKPRDSLLFLSDDANFYHMLERWRMRLRNILPNGKVSGPLLAALVLGWKYDLDFETKSHFMSSGAMHVLAVSGLHVGLVAGVLSVLLRKLGYSRRARIIRYLIVLLGTWLFAGISGLSVSSIRAALMLSLIDTGKLFNRKANSLNMLGTAGFIIVLHDAQALSDIGFQLSFLAVAGIVLYGVLIEMRTLRGWKRSIAGGTWTTLTAQAWTSSAGIYHFNAFPLWFLLGNYIALPVSTILLYLGLLWLVSWWVPWWNHLLAWALEWLCIILTRGLEWVASLPSSYITGLEFNEIQFCLSLVFLGLLPLTPSRRRLAGIAIPFALIWIILLSSSPDEPIHSSLFIGSWKRKLWAASGSLEKEMQLAGNDSLDLLRFTNGDTTRIKHIRQITFQADSVLGVSWQKLLEEDIDFAKITSWNKPWSINTNRPLILGIETTWIDKNHLNALLESPTLRLVMISPSLSRNARNFWSEQLEKRGIPFRVPWKGWTQIDLIKTANALPLNPKWNHD